MLLAKEGVSGLIVADLAIDAARDTIAECHIVATNTQFQGKAVSVDITREDSVRSLFKEMVSAFGRTDYSVNSAGVSKRSTCFEVTHAAFSFLARLGFRKPPILQVYLWPNFNAFLTSTLPACSW